MVFHVGVLWRLYEAGLLGSLKRISSVSGGSITAACWGSSGTGSASIRRGSRPISCPEVVAPLGRLAGETIDAEAVIIGTLFPDSISERVAGRL